MRQRHKGTLQRLSAHVAPRSIDLFLKGTARNEELDDLLTGVLTCGLRRLKTDQLVNITETLRSELPLKRKRLFVCLLLSPGQRASVDDLRTDIYGDSCEDNRKLNKLFADTRLQLGDVTYSEFRGLCLFQVAAVSRQLRRLEPHTSLDFEFVASMSEASRLIVQQDVRGGTWRSVVRRPFRVPNLGQQERARNSRAETDIWTLPASQTVSLEMHLHALGLLEASEEKCRNQQVQIRELKREVARLKGSEEPADSKPEPNRVLRRNLQGPRFA